MALEDERAYFDANRERFLRDYREKFVLIRGSQFIGAFDSAENAYVAALNQFGNSPVLIKQVLPEDPVAHLPALSLGLLRARP